MLGRELRGGIRNRDVVLILLLILLLLLSYSYFVSVSRLAHTTKYEGVRSVCCVREVGRGVSLIVAPPRLGVQKCDPCPSFRGC